MGGQKNRLGLSRRALIVSARIFLPCLALEFTTQQNSSHHAKNPNARSPNSPCRDRSHRMNDPVEGLVWKGRILVAKPLPIAEGAVVKCIIDEARREVTVLVPPESFLDKLPEWPFGQVKVIGLLGGIASGKSLVAQALGDRGAMLLDADAVGHEVLREPAVEAAARQRWGDAIFGADGHIQRPALAKIVFAPPPDGPVELAYLETLTHPRIETRLREQLAQLTADGKPHVLVLDAPVMLKAGWNRLCSLILFVEADRATRLRRALARGWSEAEFDAREATQEPLDFKRKMANVVIDNSGSTAETEAQIAQLRENHFANHDD
jgi:dephospho-CoA kinase